MTIEGNIIYVDDENEQIFFETFEDFKIKIDKALSDLIRNIRYGLKED